MKKHTVLQSVIASGFLFAGVVSAGSTQNNETDLIYGKGIVVAAQSEVHIAGPSMQTNQSTDMLYGMHKTQPSQGESPEKFADNRNNNTDLIYGS